MARRLAASLSEPVLVGGRRLVMSASIGVAVAQPGSDAEALMRDADAATYQAKATRRDTEVFLGSR